MKKLILLIIPIAVFGAIACKKYEDDSFISFRTANARLTGKWKLVSLKVGEKDSTDFYRTFFNDQSLWLNRDGSSSYLYGYGATIGDYGFTKNDICFQGGFLFTKVSIKDAVCYKVLKLYGKDFWIQSHFENRSEQYLVKFKKASNE